MASAELRQVRKTFVSTRIIHGAGVAIADGEFVVLVGPSGCGKSRLLCNIAVPEDVTEAGICFSGHIGNVIPPKQRDIAMVFRNAPGIPGARSSATSPS